MGFGLSVYVKVGCLQVKAYKILTRRKTGVFMAKPFRFYYLIIEAWKDVGYGGAFTLNPVRRIWEAEHTPLDSFSPHPASLFCTLNIKNRETCTCHFLKYYLFSLELFLKKFSITES